MNIEFVRENLDRKSGRSGGLIFLSERHSVLAPGWAG